jgi:hypothetical protein
MEGESPVVEVQLDPLELAFLAEASALLEESLD